MIKFRLRVPRWLLRAWLLWRRDALRDDLAAGYLRLGYARITVNEMTRFTEATESEIRALNARIAKLESPAKMLREALSSRRTR